MEPADLAPLREIHADADTLLKALYDGRASWGAARGAAERKLSAIYSMLRSEPAARAAFERLRWHPDLSAFDRPEPVHASLGAAPGNTLADGLALLALRQERWRREPEAWSGEGGDPRAVLGSLSRHLLADWPVPPFLDVAWASGYTDAARLWRDIFLSLGAGESLRQTPFPVPMTERARFHFLQAPETLTPIGALRWGQVRAMGGDERLATAAIESKLGELQDDEPFWATVLRFLADRPEYPRSQVGPLVDFLWHRRCTPGATEPELTMKGRTTGALLARVDEWHAELAKALKGQQRRRWESMGLPPYTLTERDPFGGATLEWTMIELTDTIALQEEGSELRHCVRTYSGDCVQGIKALFSLRCRASDQKTSRRMLTIELNREKRSVVQVRGRANCLPKEQPPRSRVRRAGEVVRIWARERRLGLGCHF